MKNMKIIEAPIKYAVHRLHAGVMSLGGAFNRRIYISMISTLTAVLALALSPIAAFSEVVRTGVTFVEGEGAVDEILTGPSAPCVSRLPAWELSVGEGTYSRFSARKSHEDCREGLVDAVRSFTDEEKYMLTKYVVLIDSLIDVEFPALNSFPWSFAVISDSSDFGVPNSREHIVLTKGLLHEMEDWLNKESNMLFVGMEILVHEKVRLLQNRLPEPFERFYRGTWGFRKISAPLSVDRLMQDNGLFFTRVPPNEWAIKISARDREYIMPALLLRDVGREAGGTVQRVAIVIDSTSRGFFPRRGRRMPIEYKDLRSMPHYRRLFLQSEYDYHPAELSADLLAKFMVMKYVSGRYGTAPARVANYSQIDVLMGYVNEAVR